MNIPLVADIHFDYKIALEVADTADCLRINPGNIGKEERIREVINAALHNNVPIRLVLMLVSEKTYKKNMVNLMLML